MKEPPAQTFAAVLEDLLAVPSRCVLCLEWARLPVERMRRDIHRSRRHFFNKKVSLLNYLHPDTRPEEMLTRRLGGGDGGAARSGADRS